MSKSPCADAIEATGASRKSKDSIRRRMAKIINAGDQQLSPQEIYKLTVLLGAASKRFIQ